TEVLLNPWACKAQGWHPSQLSNTMARTVHRPGDPGPNRRIHSPLHTCFGIGTRLDETSETARCRAGSRGGALGKVGADGQVDSAFVQLAQQRPALGPRLQRLEECGRTRLLVLFGTIAPAPGIAQQDQRLIAVGPGQFLAPRLIQTCILLR